MIITSPRQSTGEYVKHWSILRQKIVEFQGYEILCSFFKYNMRTVDSPRGDV